MAEPVVPRGRMAGPGAEAGQTRARGLTPLARGAGLALLPPEPRGRTPRLPAAVPVARPAAAAPRAALALAGLPLSRRIRLQRTRLERMLGSSTVLHAMVLVALGLLYAAQGKPPAPQDKSGVEMVFGQSGTVGDQAPPETATAARATPPPPVPQPGPATQEPEVSPIVPPPLPPVPVPELEPLPPPPETLPDRAPAQTRTQTMRVPLRSAPTRTARSSPFSHPMDLSLSQAPTSQGRVARRSGSNAPVDLSLGPMVRNGKLANPFATVGVKGASDDYVGELDRWVRRHMYYPPEAAANNESGLSAVRFVIDRQGNVQSVELLNSSGSYTLDAATTGMFHGARLPAPTPDMQGDRIPIEISIDYILVK